MSGEGFFTSVLILGVFVFAVFGPVLLLFRYVSPKNNKLGNAAYRFPPPFSSSLSRKEALDIVEARVTHIQSIRHKWKTTEKVEKVGRYQAMLTVPFNLSGGEGRVSFLLNLLATSKEAGGCTIEWNYVIMAPNFEPSGLSILEADVYKNTTLEIRAALFAAQGDVEEAEFLESKTESPSIVLPAAHEALKRDADGLDVQNKASQTEKEKLFQDSQTDISANRANATEKVKQETPTFAELRPADEAKQVEDTKPVAAAEIPQLQMPEIQMPSIDASFPGLNVQPGEVTNTLNFSPPDPKSSSIAPKAAGDRCVKCSQDRDPSFNFCLYCGHTD